MPSRFKPGNRDKNEGAITEYLRRANVKYFLLPEGAGADILLYTSPMALVEVKNPAVPPSERRLTEIEKETMLHCKELEIPYYVVEKPETMADIINAYIDRSEWLFQPIGEPYVQ